MGIVGLLDTSWASRSDFSGYGAPCMASGPCTSCIEVPSPIKSCLCTSWNQPTVFPHHPAYVAGLELGFTCSKIREVGPAGSPDCITISQPLLRLRLPDLATPLIFGTASSSWKEKATACTPRKLCSMFSDCWFAVLVWIIVHEGFALLLSDFSLYPFCTFAFVWLLFWFLSLAWLPATLLLAPLDTILDCVFASYVCVVVRKGWLPFCFCYMCGLLFVWLGNQSLVLVLFHLGLA